MKLFDCATPLTPETAANFKANGYDGVARYLVPSTSAWKALTKAEADIIQAAGLKIISVYETTADRALGDYQAGVANAKTAMQVAAQVGQPTGSTIYFTVDFDPADAQLSGPIAGYFSGIHDTLVGYDVGVYGNYDVCVFLKGKGLVTHLWETYAWSSHQLADVNIYQYLNGPNGADYDEDRGFGFEGAWGNGPTAVQPTAAPTTMDPGVALTILNTWMKPSYDATKDQAQKDYIRWLGQKLRTAAGLPLDG